MNPPLVTRFGVIPRDNEIFIVVLSQILLCGSIFVVVIHDKLDSNK